MSEGRVWYKKRRRYKYSLAEDFPLQLELRPETEIVTPFIVLTTDGLLTIRKGYAWDGPSGPAVDTETTLSGQERAKDLEYRVIAVNKGGGLPVCGHAQAGSVPSNTIAVVL
ncbi:hypothetical protein ACFL34_03180 [Candidatus Sumerlaeota bacterium]